MLIEKIDCFVGMSKLKDKSIDLIFADPPYLITNNSWDKKFDLPLLWAEFRRLIKDSGVIVFTASQPFTSEVITLGLDYFKYEIIWVKSIGSGQLNINKMPLKKHESILIFSPSKLGNFTYNEILSEGKPYSINRDIKTKNNYSSQKPISIKNSGIRRMTSIWEINNPRIRGQHPTQKPAELLERIISCYSNEEDLVFDPTFGSGISAKSALKLNRKYIGFEIDPTYFNLLKGKYA